MKIYITKYALTKGIFEVDANIRDSGIAEDRTEHYIAYYSKDSYCKDKQSAIKKADEMRKKKIVSLKKKIEKLEKMKFE